jgi:hypothetical protein
MRNIEEEAYVATMLTMKPARRILQHEEDIAEAACDARQSKYRRKWSKVYAEILVELKEDEDAGH